MVSLVGVCEFLFFLAVVIFIAAKVWSWTFADIIMRAPKVLRHRGSTQAYVASGLILKLSASKEHGAGGGGNEGLSDPLGTPGHMNIYIYIYIYIIVTQVTQSFSRPSWLDYTTINGALVPSIQRLAFPSLVVTCKLLGLSPRGVEAAGLGMLRQSARRTWSEHTLTLTGRQLTSLYSTIVVVFALYIVVVLPCIACGLTVTWTVICILYWSPIELYAILAILDFEAQNTSVGPT